MKINRGLIEKLYCCLKLKIFYSNLSLHFYTFIILLLPLNFCLQEAGSINKSLSILGNVIMSLVDIAHGKSRHIPYRDSRLTFLLRVGTFSKEASFYVFSVGTVSRKASFYQFLVGTISKGLHFISFQNSHYIWVLLSR